MNQYKGVDMNLTKSQKEMLDLATGTMGMKIRVVDYEESLNKYFVLGLEEISNRLFTDSILVRVGKRGKLTVISISAPCVFTDDPEEKEDYAQTVAKHICLKAFGYRKVTIN